MYEIERKFEADEAFLKKLPQCGRFVSKGLLRDVYYDLKERGGVNHEVRLRCRNGVYELKCALPHLTDARIDCVEELTDCRAICERINLPESDSLEVSLQRSGIIPLAVVESVREIYELDGVVITLDQIEVKGKFFQIAEAEIVVDSFAEVSAAEIKLVCFLKTYGIIDLQRPKGKLRRFLEALV